MFCSKCGTENKVGTNFCKKCGNKLETNNKESLDKGKDLKKVSEKKEDLSLKEEKKADKKEELKKDSVICSKCGSSNEKGMKFCKKCGTKLKESNEKILDKVEEIKKVPEKNEELPQKEGKKADKKEELKKYSVICSKCGSSNEKGMKFCKNCGTKLEESNEKALDKDEEIKKVSEKKEDLHLKEEKKVEKKETKNDSVICSKCGSSNEKGMKFCKNCGTKLETGNEKKLDEAKDLNTVFEVKEEVSLSQNKNETISENLVCSKCGKKNESGTKFCMKCGSPLSGITLEKNQSFTEKVVINDQIISNTIKKKKKRKWPFILILFIIIALGLVGGYLYLDRKTSPESFIKEYMEAISNKDYSSLYNYSSFVGDTTFIREEDYTDALKDIKYIDTISSYEIDSIDYEDSYVEVDLDIVYENIGKKDMTVKLKKSGGKEYLLFDKWILVSSDRIDINVINDYKIIVPKDANVTFNNIEVSKDYLDESKDNEDIYVLPQILSASSKLKVSLANGMKIVKNITPSKWNNEYELAISKSDVSSSEQEAIIEATKKDLGIMMNGIIGGKEFDEIKDSLAESSDLEDLEEIYNSYVSDLNNYRYNLVKFDLDSLSIISVKFDDDYLLKVEQRIKYNWTASSKENPILTRDESNYYYYDIYLTYENGNYKVVKVSSLPSTYTYF